MRTLSQGFFVLTVAGGLLMLSRSTLAADRFWTNAGGGNWNGAANWGGDAPPGAGDNAFITLDGSYTVTLDINTTVGSLTLGAASGVQTLEIISRTLVLNAPSTVEANGVFALRTSTLTLTDPGGSLTNRGLVRCGGACVINGIFSNAAGATLRIEGSNAGSNATVTFANAFENSGTITFTAIDSAKNTTLNVTTGTIVNKAGALIDFRTGTGGTRAFNAPLDNQGTIDVAAATTVGKTSAVHANSGAININGGSLTFTLGGTNPSLTNTGAGVISLTGGDLAVNPSGTNASFTNNGTITLPATRTLSVSGGTFNQNTSAAAWAGTLSLATTIASFATDLSNAGMALTLSGATINGPGALTNATGKTLALNGSIINAPLNHQAGATVLATGTCAINGTFSNPGGATLRVEGNNTLSNAVLTAASGFTNDGTITLTSVDTAKTATLNVTTGPLVNAAGALIDIRAGTGGARNLNAALNNQGGIDVAIAATISKNSAIHTNNGAININGGALTLTLGGTNPSFTNTNNGSVNLTGGSLTLNLTGAGAVLTNNGTLTLPASRTLSVTGGTFSQNTSTATWAGALSLTGTTASFGLGLSNAALTLALSGATVNGPGILTNAAGKTLNLNGSIINAPLANEAGATVLATGTCAINGTFTSAPTAALRVEGNNAGSNARLDVANGFTNNGSITLTSIEAVKSATLNVGGGTLANAPGAVIEMLAGTGGARTLGAQIDNQGTININAAATLVKGSADHTNGGTINLAGGNLTITQSGTTPTFTNSGAVNIPAGRTLAVAGAAYTQTGGTTTLSGGTLQPAAGASIQGGVLIGVGTVSGNLTNNGGQVSPGASPGVLAITGNYTQTAAGTLSVEIGGLTAASQYDQLTITGAASLDGTCAITLFNNFVPTLGNQFTLMTFGSRTGAFATYAGACIGPTLGLAQRFAPGNLTLLARASCFAADMDADSDVDLSDFVLFATCFNGPNRPPAAPDCADADFVADNDVDLDDFQKFAACFNGPNRQPACN